jgi:integrase/recombinase XerD
MRQILFNKDFISCYEESPVAELLRDFDQWLREVRYCKPRARAHIGYVRFALERAGARPADWRFDAKELDRLFRSRIRPRNFVHARWAFEQYLRARDRWIATLAAGPHQELLDGYTTYMCDLEGLAPATITQRIRVARALLAVCCRPPRTPADLTPRDVERFVARQAGRLGRAAITSTVGYLRKFFRYCHERGLCPAGLDEIDRPHRYRDEQPPRAIPWDLAQRLLASIDRSTRMGCRDYTMLYLMAHYGLRTGDVCGLTVADFDRRARVLKVGLTKVRSTLRLPLSRATIRVLERYLRHGRPRIDLPELFLSVAAPIAPMTRGAVAEAFRRHVERSGLPLTDHSPYGLRHGFAMRLLERGVGIKAIGDLLGHRTFESTAVYLRLNTEALRDVALQVPRAVRREAL